MAEEQSVTTPKEEHQSKPGPDTTKAEAALKARLSRKRTKTGCLTCRKRRIKCGEEHPVCKNCIKSKRLCEGYNQRVIFKPPAFDYRAAPNGAAHITFQADQMGAPASTVPQAHVPQYTSNGVPYAALQPQQTAQYGPQVVYLNGQQYVVPQQPHYTAHDMQSQQHNLQPVPVEQHVALPYHAQLQALQRYHAGSQSAATFEQAIAQVDNVHAHVQYPVQARTGPTESASQHRVHNIHQQETVGTANLDWYEEVQQTSPALKSASMPAPLPIGSSAGSIHLDQTPVNFGDGRSWNLPTYTPRPELSRPIDRHEPFPPKPSMYMHPVADATGLDFLSNNQINQYSFEHALSASTAPVDLLNEAAVEIQDDDYYDVESDEEMDVEQAFAIAKDTRRERTLNTILMRQHFDVHNMQMRRYDTFIMSGMLDHYRVEQVANPLKNPATARVFAHFISATGPSLTTFDRHSVSSSVLFTQGAVPVSQQGLWTYILPMKALHHQGLLHAMLAMSSLHIARLEGASATPSMQHYAWALKHIHKCVASPNKKKRLAVTTIAASMLLGFYEIFTAEHMKWNTHLMGAKQLFVETDFASMTKQFRRMKREKAATERIYGRRNSFSMQLNGIFHDDGLDQVNDVDDNVISRLVGREVRYDQQGHIEDPQIKAAPALDVKKFEILKDLYWWYCKQDAYQSIVSGNPLLLDFSRWTDCPPRAPLGRSDAVYGCSDHLTLILGRIADFASKDRERKLKQMEANGGQWRPAPGMKMPASPKPPPAASIPNSANGGMHQGPPPGPPPAQPQPAFYGMAPPPSKNAQMPASYRARDQPHMPQAAHTSGPMDLQAATQAALEEYGRIRAALRAFADALSGEAFQPLAADLQPPLVTPFGPALFYRSYDIGCLWSVYNMCVIIAIRSHPHMHPAAHVAAGLAAQETAPYANEIGRIAAGIVPGPANQPLNPTLGSALCDSCMPSFFAAVQYQRPDERHETVMRIYGIALRTGWGSAELMANGCETAWVKAAEAGRGPPYQRVVRPRTSDDPRLNGKWEKLDMTLDPEEEDLGDRRYIKSKPMSRLQWAIGIMGTEGDIPELP